MATHSLSPTESTSRRLYVGLWALSGLSLAGFMLLSRPLLAVGSFAGCAVAALAVFRWYDGPLFDERDESYQAAASRRTLSVLGVSAAVGFPTVTALWALGVVAWPRWLTPVAFFVAVLAFVHVGSLLYETSQPR